MLSYFRIIESRHDDGESILLRRDLESQDSKPGSADFCGGGEIAERLGHLLSCDRQLRADDDLAETKVIAELIPI